MARHASPHAADRLSDPRAPLSALRVSSERWGRVRIVTVAGELDISTAPSLCAGFRDDRGRARCERVVLDLTSVAFCESAGLRAVMRAAEEVRIAGGRVVLVVPGHGFVRRLVDLTGVHEFLPVASSRAAALDAFLH